MLCILSCDCLVFFSFFFLKGCEENLLVTTGFLKVGCLEFMSAIPTVGPLLKAVAILAPHMCVQANSL